MKLRKLFASATLAIGLSFTANAELIKQSFGLEVAGLSATIELGALTEKSGFSAAPDYFWADQELEYFNILGLDADGNGPQDFKFSGTQLVTDFNLLEASAKSGSISGAGADNGFLSVLFELNLESISNALTGIIVIEIFNDAFGSEAVISDLFANNGSFTIADLSDPTVNLTVGAVTVNAPLTALLVFLSFGGLLAARRK